MNSKYKNFNHKRLDSLIHNRLRLAILSAVAHSDEVDFMSLKNAVKTTDGNLSIQLKKLEESGFLTINKSRQSGRAQTNMALTNKGYTALMTYKELLLSWLDV